MYKSFHKLQQTEVQAEQEDRPVSVLKNKSDQNTKIFSFPEYSSAHQHITWKPNRFILYGAQQMKE